MSWKSGVALKVIIYSAFPVSLMTAIVLLWGNGKNSYVEELKGKALYCYEDTHDCIETKRLLIKMGADTSEYGTRIVR